MNEYHLSAEDSPDIAMLFERDDDHTAINDAADVVSHNKSCSVWTLSLVERGGDKSEHTSIDAKGSHKLVEVAKFDKAVGIIYSEL